MIGNGKGREVYFMGIIDVLQEYNARKHAETALKVNCSYDCRLCQLHARALCV
jgi:Phosphatidylinositol-4-phosphate 5-Kinase